MNTDHPQRCMKELGEDNHGRKWFLADNSFLKPGIYYWNGSDHVHVNDLVQSVEEFTKHVGAPNFVEAKDVLLRTKASDEDTIERQFDTIKSISRSDKDAPLKASVEGECLVIRIGIDVLAFSTRTENGGHFEEVFIRPNAYSEFARDVAKEIMREDEIGNMPVCDFLDEMMENACNHGSEAIQEK